MRRRRRRHEWCAVENALGTLGILWVHWGGRQARGPAGPAGRFQCETATNELRGLSAAIPNRLGGFTTTSFVFRGRVHPTPAHTDLVFSAHVVCRLGTDERFTYLTTVSHNAVCAKLAVECDVHSRVASFSTIRHHPIGVVSYALRLYRVQLHATVSRPLVYCPFRSLLCSTRAQLQARISAHARRAGRSIPCRPPKEPGGSEN